MIVPPGLFTPSVKSPKRGEACGFVTGCASAVQVVPSKEYSPLYESPVFVRRSQMSVVPTGTSACGCGCCTALPTSERSSMRLMRVLPSSEMASNFTYWPSSV